MSETEHTPTPWAVCLNPPNPQWFAEITIYDIAGDRRVADVASLMAPSKANAEFIVRACNAHDQLVEAMALIKAFNSYPGLAVKESILLNRIYKIASKAEKLALPALEFI